MRESIDPRTARTLIQLEMTPTQCCHNIHDLFIIEQATNYCQNSQQTEQPMNQATVKNHDQPSATKRQADRQTGMPAKQARCVDTERLEAVNEETDRHMLSDATTIVQKTASLLSTLEERMPVRRSNNRCKVGSQCQSDGILQQGSRFIC